MSAHTGTGVEHRADCEMYGPRGFGQGKGRMTMDNTSKILLRAAELIAAGGWAQGAYERSDGRLCALGAINYVATGDSARPRDTQDVAAARNRLLVTLGKQPSVSISPLTLWNDARRRTAEEVIDTLIAAAYWEDGQ
jgi:hypothetical protein